METENDSSNAYIDCCIIFGNLRAYCIHNLTSIIILARHVFPMLYIGTSMTFHVKKKRYNDDKTIIDMMNKHCYAQYFLRGE